MPSATARSPSPSDSRSTPATNRSARPSPPSRLTKDRSILRISTGKRSSCDSDDQPVPKSSTAIFTPMATTACRASLARSRSSASADSVTSSTRCSADSSYASSRSRTIPASRPSSSWRAETFTLIVKGSASVSSKTGQLLKAAQAACMTRVNSAADNPACSASGTKTSGPTIVPSGSAPAGERFHRAQPSGVEIDDWLEDREDALAVRVEEHVPQLRGQRPLPRTK